MRKIKLLILVFFIGLTFSAASQTTPWINPGAVWYYHWSDPSSGMVGNYKIEYTHDTVLFGTSCQILKTTDYWYGHMTSGSPLTLLFSQTGERYTYNNGDTVFYLTDSAFKVLYNFGAQPGDTWDLGIDTNWAYCSKSIVKVTGVSFLNIGGNSHRVLNVNDSSNSTVGISGPIIEHIGSVNFLFPLGRNCDSTTIVDFFEFSLFCFNDATVSYNLIPQAECSNPYHVGINESTYLELFTLSPNPTNGVFSLNFINHNGSSIVVFNSTGQICFSAKTTAPNILIDLSDLSNGLYLISVDNEKGEKTFKKLVKN